MENRYLEEWLRHYVGLGVDKIVIFDNNDIEGKYAENIFDLEYVKECKSKEIIDVYPIPGEKQAQTKSYNKCYEMYGENYDWLMFFDIDEFLILEKHSTIQEFLAQPIFTPYEMIHINWKVYDDNDLVRVKDNDYSLVKRFTRVSRGKRSIHSELKSIIRGGMKHVKFTKNPHTCNNRTFKCCNALGNETDSQLSKTTIIIHKDAWLNHYICKTMEEFCYNKLIRRGGHTMHKKDLRYNITFFFNYNQRTLEKIKYFKENFDGSAIDVATNYIATPTEVIIKDDEDVKTIKRAGAATAVPKYVKPEPRRVKRHTAQPSFISPVKTSQPTKQTSIKPLRKISPDVISAFKNK